MTAPPPPTGQARVRLHVADGRVARADVSVARPAAAARKLLLGKTPAEALKLVPLLFAVCGAAQAAAAAAACEQAMGVEAAPAQRTARAMLAAAEALNGHARFMMLDWPRAAGQPPLIEEFAKLRKGLAAIPAALYPDRDAFAPGGGRLSVDVRPLVNGVKAASDVVGGLLSAPEHLQRTLFAEPSPFIPHLLRGLDAAWFGARLAAAPAFAAFPDDDGVPALNAPLAEFADTPGLRALLSDCGLSPVSLYAGRIAAAMAELSTLIDGAGELTMDAPPPAMEAAPRPEGRPDGAGCGAVRAARGRLAHWVRLQTGRVADWRAVAPTEWNFHPQGPLALALTGVPAGCDPAGQSLAQRAERLVCALDPCVPWRVDIVEGDGQEKDDKEKGGGDA